MVAMYSVPIRRQQFFHAQGCKLFAVGAVAAFALMALGHDAQATILNSITQIPNGTTVNFEGASSLNQALIIDNMLGSPNLPTTGITGIVTGNMDAPVSGTGVFLSFGANTLIAPTSGPGWSDIGVAFVSGNTTIPTSIVFNAFDAQNNFLASVGVSSVVDGTISGYNAGARFVGLHSAIPIAAIVISNQQSGSSMVVDNLRFNVVPEPSTFVLVGLGLVGFVALRKKFRRA